MYFFLSLYALCVAAVGLAWLPVVCEKGNFPMAECNKLSGKCFSHTPLGAWV